MPTASKILQQASNLELNGEYLLWIEADKAILYVPNSGTLRLDVIERFHCPAFIALLTSGQIRPIRNLADTSIGLVCTQTQISSARDAMTAK